MPGYFGDMTGVLTPQMLASLTANTEQLGRTFQELGAAIGRTMQPLSGYTVPNTSAAPVVTVTDWPDTPTWVDMGNMDISWGESGEETVLSVPHYGEPTREELAARVADLERQLFDRVLQAPAPVAAPVRRPAGLRAVDLSDL